MITPIANARGYDWPTWLMGIWRAIIGGGSNGVLSGLLSMGIDPEHFNLSTGLDHTLKMVYGMFLGAAVMHLFIFLSTHSAPEKNTP